MNNNYLTEYDNYLNYLLYHGCQVYADIVIMKNKYMSKQSNELLSYLNGLNMNCFDYSMAYKAVSDSKASAVRELLSDMTKRGLIEKDYILSWILFGIAKHEQLSKVIVFKGGTVLKKVYFEDYRFSEDLDFTFLQSKITNEQIFEWFMEVFKFLKEEANIPLEIINNNEHEDSGMNYYISFIGPLGGHGNSKWVKVDISRSEQLVFKPVMKEIFVDYPDLEAYKLLCYPLEEVLVEKMRSVMQRMQARDFYDIWYLLE